MCGSVNFEILRELQTGTGANSAPVQLFFGALQFSAVQFTGFQWFYEPNFQTLYLLTLIFFFFFSLS